MKPALSGGGIEQIIAANHFVDRLVGVVDDDRQVISKSSVLTGDDEIVDGSLLLAVDAIEELDPSLLGTDSKRRVASRRPAFSLLLG